MQLKVNLIAAACENMGIGANGDLPWRLKNEMAFFNKMTSSTLNPAKKNAVIMGRKTWDSIPPKFRPLKGRFNVVLSTQSNLNVGEDAIVCGSLQSAVESLAQPPLLETIESVWVIGGSAVYKEAMESENCHRVYLTAVLKNFECDTFFPPIGEDFKLVTDTNVPTEIQEEDGIKYKYQIFEKIKE